MPERLTNKEGSTEKIKAVKSMIHAFSETDGSNDASSEYDHPYPLVFLNSVKHLVRRFLCTRQHWS